MVELEGGFSTGKEETNRRWWIPPIIATPFICLDYKGSAGGRAAAAAIPKTRANENEPTPEDLENKLSPRGSCSWGSPLLRASTLPSAPAIHDRPLSAFPHAECSKRPKAAPTLTPALNYEGSGHACCVWPGPEQWRHLEPGEAAAKLAGCSSPGCHQRGCQAVPEAELPKDLPAVLKSQEQDNSLSMSSDSGCELEEDESCSTQGIVKKSLYLEGPAAGIPHLPGAQEASWHKQGDASCEHAVRADVENGFCSSDGSVREPLAPQGTSATGNEHKRNLSRSLGERFRCHPVGTAVLILLVLVLVLALVVALAVQSAAPQVPVTPATPLSLLGCPRGWVGYKGVCYYFSPDYSTWEHGQERCSKLNASLAIAKDEEAMDLLFRLRGNVDFWLGLRRRGERLHWGDGSSYSSRVPVFDDFECVYVAENELRSGNCSNERPYVCSKAQAPL